MWPIDSILNKAARGRVRRLKTINRALRGRLAMLRFENKQLAAVVARDRERVLAETKALGQRGKTHETK